VRFLVDRCAGARLARWLASEGHDVVDSASWKQDPGDLALLQTAADDNRILVTIDQDFGVLVFAEERTHHGIVRLRMSPRTNGSGSSQTFSLDTPTTLRTGR
jgi:predicted nuclease of predicted toxin-antitoxin system